MIAKKPGYRGKALFDVLFKNGQVDKYPLQDIEAGYENAESQHFGFYVQKGLFEEYASFGRGHGHDLAPFDTYHQTRGLRWPVVDGKETRWRFREGSQPLCQSRQGIRLLWLSRRQGTYLCLTLRATCREPRRPISILAHDWSRAGALAFRISDPAGPGAAQSSAERALLYAPR